jgi:putative chitinase
MITSNELRFILEGPTSKPPNGSMSYILSTYLQPLINAMSEFSINTPNRMACFIAQVAHETDGFLYMRELASGTAYEFRQDLGNISAGDGVKYKGGGGLMATGRLMYERLASKFDQNLVSNPSLIEEPILSMRSAAYIWTEVKQLNPLADVLHFFEITHRINGGYNGGDSRLKYFLRCVKLFGV